MGKSRMRHPDMIELLPKVIHEYCEDKIKRGISSKAIVFCPNYNYMRKLILDIIAEDHNDYKTIDTDYLVYKYDVQLRFTLPDYNRILGDRPDTYFIFQYHPFEKENKQMWESIRRFW